MAMACKCPIDGDRASGTGNNVPNACHQHLVTTTIRNEDQLSLLSPGEPVRQTKYTPQREERTWVLFNW